MLYDAARLVFEPGSMLRLNGGSGGGSTGAFPQIIDYSWHIRGGLRGLNLNAGGSPDLTGGKSFALQLGYEDAGYYNGNIGSQTWLNGSQPSQVRSYSYDYDGADRLTAANYGGDTYTVNGITYDANGNIQTMTRNGVDQLAYRYDDANQSNKLLAVTDATSSTVGFSDGNTTGDDYEYYPDGSLKKDLNRGITDIQYNLLKLPRQLTFSSGKVVSYQYDAGGRKLKMTVSGGDVRDYVGPFQYLNGSLFEISHEEGRYSPTGDYEYFHKDHLGNVRVAFGAGGITQYTDYDPWGLPLWGGLSGGSSTNRMQYNGKEAVSEQGTGVYDYGARGYDAVSPRFWQIDPLARKWNMVSPYSYALNNPLNIIDPDGRDNVVYLQVLKSAYKDYSRAEVKSMVKQANANFKEMGLNTRVMISKGDINIKKLDKTDAVTVFGRRSDVIKKVESYNKVFGEGLKNSTWGSGGNAERSQNGLPGGNGNNLIAIESRETKLGAKEVSATQSQFGAFLINHGAGHNAGITAHAGETMSTGVTIPAVSVMASGADLQQNGLNGYRAFQSYITSPSNDKGIIHESYIQRFGNHQAVATQPVEN